MYRGYCPLFTIANLVGGGEQIRECFGPQCQWWDEDDCAVKKFPYVSFKNPTSPPPKKEYTTLGNIYREVT